jgi:hypothetical protein
MRACCLLIIEALIETQFRDGCTDDDYEHFMEDESVIFGPNELGIYF